MSSRVLFLAVHGVAVIAVLLSLVTVAYGQTPATDQYGSKVKGVSVSQAQQQPATAVAAEESALPNTGLSLLGVVLVGGALVGMGLALRRRGHDTTD